MRLRFRFFDVLIFIRGLFVDGNDDDNADDDDEDVDGGKTMSTITYNM